MSPRRPDGPSLGDGLSLRVGYVLKKYPRLSETFILDEILGLEAARAEVSVYSLRLPDDGRFHADVSRVRGPVRYLPEFGSVPTLEAFRTAGELGIDPGRLSRALRFVDRVETGRRAPLLIQGLHLAGWAVRDGIGHLHAHFMTVAAQTAYLAHLFTGIPFTVTAHAKDIYRYTVDREMFREVAAAARAVVTVCRANHPAIERLLGSSGGRIEVVYNGVALDELGAGPAGTRDPNLILAVGRLVEKKGYHVLLEACRALADRGVDFHCVVAGEGDQRERLEADRARLGLEDRVQLAGAAPRDRVMDWMRSARVLAAPCLTADDGNRDALPTVALEALALGLPVVSTPVGGIPEIVDHGVDGLLVPEGDAVALAEALDRLLADDVLWARMSRAGPAKAALRFDRRRNLPRLIALFRGEDEPAAALREAVP